jgi:hypothetical protein
MTFLIQKNMGAALFFADGNHDKYELDVLNKVISRFEK